MTILFFNVFRSMTEVDALIAALSNEHEKESQLKASLTLKRDEIQRNISTK